MRRWLPRLLSALLALSAMLALTHTAVPQPVAVAGAVTASPPPLQWQWANPRPQGNHLLDITYGAGIYVTVGHGGTILTSPTGATWIPRPAGTPSDLRAVAYGNNQFVVLGADGLVLRSRDGMTWTPAKSKLEHYQALAFGNGRFVAVGNKDFIATSPDGVAWTETRVGADELYLKVSFTGGKFVAVGGYGSVAISTDGATWQPHPAAILFEMTGVAHGNGVYVAVGAGLGTLISPDAKTWTRHPSGSLVTVIFARGQFFAAEPSGSILSSANGIDWQPVRTPSQHIIIRFVYAADQIVGVGTSGSIVTSPDGESWTTRTQGHALSLKAVTYGHGRFVAVGNSGAIVTSPDGLAWSVQASPTQVDLQAVTAGPGGYVAVGKGGTVITATDGATWTARSSAASENLAAVAYGNGRYVALGENVVLSSADGFAWERAILPQNQAKDIWGKENGTRSVAFGQGQFTAVGSYEDFLTSPDGRTWTLTAYDPSDFGYGMGIAAAGDRLAAVGVRGIATRGSESVWIMRARNRLQNVLQAVAYGSDRFVAAGERGRIDISMDGVRWVSHPSGIRSDLTGIAYGQGRFVAVGADGATVVTVDIPPAGTCAGFTDMLQTHEACSAVEDMVAAKLVAGYPDGTFHPNAPVSRAEFTKLLITGLGETPTPTAPSTFTDVQSHWIAATGYLQPAVRSGFVSGFPDGTFRPDAPLSRGQLARMAAGAVKLKLEVHPRQSLYSDLTEDLWFGSWAAAAQRAKLLGYWTPYPVWAGSTFAGDTPVTRAEAVMVLANLSRLR